LCADAESAGALETSGETVTSDGDVEASVVVAVACGGTDFLLRLGDVDADFFEADIGTPRKRTAGAPRDIAGLVSSVS
jgi:hypothetical protein